MDDDQETCSRPTSPLALNFNPAVSLLNDATSDQGLLERELPRRSTTPSTTTSTARVFFAHIPRKTTDCNTLAQLALPGADHPSMGHCASNGHQLFGTNDFPVANTTWSSGAGLTAPPDVPALSGYTWRYNVASSFFFRNNGAAVANATLPSHSGRDFYLMRDADDNVNDGAGDMSEAVMYTRQLTALENQKVDSYLAIKYGVTLSQVDADELPVVDQPDHLERDDGGRLQPEHRRHRPRRRERARAAAVARVSMSRRPATS